MFERMFAKVTDAIREGETIAKPMKENSRLGFHPIAAFLWFFCGAFMPLAVLCLPGVAGAMGGPLPLIGAAFAFGVLCILWYLLQMNTRVADDLVVNMIDVGEETGELDTMLYKVADVYDEEVTTLTDGLMKLIEPLLIVFLGICVGFIVISLFMPLIGLIQGLA
jgi:type IV pilus assembly protein PilC